MASITVELLRKRAEHNDGEVSSLREVSLHQQELKRIELLGSVCRHLQILYLQCNLIPPLRTLAA
jgi:protein TilB